MADFFHTALYLFHVLFPPESKATDLNPEIKSRLEFLETILLDVPLEVQRLFVDGVLIQAKALRTPLERADFADLEPHP